MENLWHFPRASNLVGFGLQTLVSVQVIKVSGIGTGVSLPLLVLTGKDQTLQASAGCPGSGLDINELRPLWRGHHLQASSTASLLVALLCP